MPGGLRGRGSRNRRRNVAVTVLLRHDDDDEALALVAAPRGAADEVVWAGSRERHGGVAGLVRGDGVCRAAAVVVVLGDLQHRVCRGVELEHCMRGDRKIRGIPESRKLRMLNGSTIQAIEGIVAGVVIYRGCRRRGSG